jgi:hypothetical protein
VQILAINLKVPNKMGGNALGRGEKGIFGAAAGGFLLGTAGCGFLREGSYFQTDR